MLFSADRCSEGQLISKANCQALNSSKKRTNEFVFTSMRRVLVCIVEEIENSKKAFRNYMTFSFFTQIFMNWLQLSEIRTWPIRWNLEKCSRKCGCLFLGKWSFIKDNIYRTREERYSSPKRKILFLSFIFIHICAIHALLDFLVNRFLFIFNFPSIILAE